MANKLSNLIKQGKAFLSDFVGGMNHELDSTRQQIAKLRAQRNVIAQTSIDQADLEKRVDQAVDEMAARLHSHRLAATYLLHPESSTKSLEEDLKHLTPLELLCAVNPDLLRQSAKMFYSEKLQAQGGGRSLVERAAQLRELDSELDRLEILEEEGIMGMEAAGVFADRRPDCRPEIIMRVGVSG